MKKLPWLTEAMKNAADDLLAMGGFFPLPNPLLAWVENIPFRDLRAADKLCFVFAVERRWPRIPIDQRLQIFLRIQFAQSAGASLLDPGVQGMLAEDVILEQLLISRWHECGLQFAATIDKKKSRSYLPP
jgi:hypothetical protein